MTHPLRLAPSILSADFAKLGAECDAVLEAGAELIHFDVMDNHFVPNLTLGPMVCQALRNNGLTAPIDVHLMVQPVTALIEAFAKAGASMISFHPEASTAVSDDIALIKKHGLEAGLAVNPDTALELVTPHLAELDFVLTMSVYPGFGGQTFIEAVLPRLQQIKQLSDEQALDLWFEIDGGINAKTITKAYAAGADTFVAGSAIFGSQPYEQNIAVLKGALA